MTTTINRYNLIRSLAIGLVVVSGVLGVAFVGAQESETTKGSIVSDDAGTEAPRGDKGGDESGPIDVEPSPDTTDPCAMPTTEEALRILKNKYFHGTFTVETGTGSVANDHPDCTYPFAMKVFKVYDAEDPQVGQTLFDEDRATVAPGATETLSVDLPECRYQLDIVMFPDAPYLPSNVMLLKGEINEGLPVCPPSGPIATLTLTKEVINNNGGTKQVSDFKLYVGTTQVLSGATNQFPVGTYTVHEDQLPGYVAGIWEGDCTPDGTVTLSSGQHKHCVIKNDDVGDQCPLTDLPHITSPTSIAARPGQTISYQITTSGNPSTVAVTQLPSWLTFNSTTNTLSGTVPSNASQNYSVVITATNACGKASVTLRIVIIEECPVPAVVPIITLPALPTSVVGTVGVPITPYGFSVEHVNQPILVQGLPPGLQLAWSTGSTWAISGTPTLAGTFTATITAINQCGFAEKTITIVIGGGSCPLTPPVITSPQTATATVGSPFSYTVTTTGTVSNITVANLPAGLSFSGTTISGTPTQTGTFTAIITASNRCASTAINLVITVGGFCPYTPPVITSPQTASGTVGSPFSYTLTTTGTVSQLTVTTDTLPLGLNYQNGVISGTPTQAGTFIAIITASNQCASTAINLTITIGGGSCPLTPPVITSPQTATATVGSPFSYTLATTGTVSNITVANLPAGLSYSNSVISGKPTQTGTFTAIITASNRCASTAINLRITIGGGGDDDDDDDNGGGGGGHRRRPNVVLFAEPEVLGASISLAQIPYTGLGTSIFQLVLFILGLLAISGGIIYTIMRRVRQSPPSSVTVTTGPARTTVSVGNLSTQGGEAVDEPVLAAYEEYASAAPLPRPVAKSTSAQTGYRLDSPRVESGAPANIPMETPGRAESRPSQSSVPAIQKSTEVQAPAHVSAARIQNEARSSRTLISDDGAELIAGSVEGDEKKAIERLNQIVEIAKSRYPREDGWLILDKDRVRETLFISTLSMIPLFIEWIVRGEDKKVFTFLRMLKHQEQPVADFMRKVVSDLDNAYRARMEGSDERANVNQHIAEVTYHLSNKELETIVGELLHGVDERYDSAYTSVRLSLVRVLDIVKERALRSVGSAYAFVDSSRIEAGGTVR